VQDVLLDRRLPMFLPLLLAHHVVIFPIRPFVAAETPLRRESMPKEL
jgi:hypothetical protein